MSRYFPDAADLGRHNIFPGVSIQTCTCDNVTLSLASLDARAVVAEHAHPHEQVGLVLEGRATFCIADEERVLGPGDFFRIPSGVRHRVVVHDQPLRVLDIFHPVREEYR